MKKFKIMVCVFSVLMCAVSFGSPPDYNNPLTSEPETLTLWHMDSIQRDATSSWVENDLVNADKQ